MAEDEDTSYCATCGDIRDAWRHLLPAECPGTTGLGCNDPSQHHPYERYDPEAK